MMKILAVEPYLGGSHKAFLDGLARHSRHEWTTVGLPPYKWKWRMRHAPITLAEQVSALIRRGETFDLLFCSDMLNLAEFRGLTDKSVLKLPSVIYFHENQLTYPVRDERERDMHFGMTNFISCLAADQIWFNSRFHEAQFLTALRELLGRMPDYQLLDRVDWIADRASVVFPGIETIKPSNSLSDHDQPLQILWVARWEHDKNPGLFFEALGELANKNLPFQVSVIGEQFEDIPPEFAQARERFSDRIVHWGYLSTREQYLSALQGADIVVSTADHEFYGIAVLEAVAAGCWPILPNHLSYPELLQTMQPVQLSEHLYDGSCNGLVERLTDLITGKRSTRFSPELRRERSDWVVSFRWSSMIDQVDDQLERLAAELS